ncbi:hypothetical protein LPJ56_004271 [Coemansia sp. RSA 2599]|nr:hypothetical protein LPJ75_004093 [Coemansia sp. RSA 2598]KAJ1816549.1 hypothetical protein LPJ56_004271 [Coemansia sp. RSA 2599]
MKFVSVASVLALAAAVQASPAIVTVTKTAPAVVHTVVTVPRIHYVYKTVFATVDEDDESSSAFESSEFSDPEPTYLTSVEEEITSVFEETTSAERTTSSAPSPSSESTEQTSAVVIPTTEIEEPTTSSSSAAPSSTSTDSGSQASNWMTTMICRINAVRAAHGAQPLGISSVLNDLALQQSQYQNSIQQMTHSNPAGGLGTRLSNRGVAWSAAAENVAAGMQSAEQAQQALENSSGHLANMVSTNMAYVGVGRVNGYYTQEFYALPGNARPDTVPNCN